jgi:hypothetical protein
MNWIDYNNKKPPKNQVCIGLDNSLGIVFFKLLGDSPLILYRPWMGEKNISGKISYWLEMPKEKNHEG